MSAGRCAVSRERRARSPMSVSWPGRCRGAWLVSLLLAALPVAASAQSCPALAGSWKLAVRASVNVRSLGFNPYYQVRAVELRLHFTHGRVYQYWAFRGAHLHEHWAYSFKPDGVRYPTHTQSKLYSVPTWVAATWQNCTLIVDGHSRLFGQKITTLSTYVFSPDGTTLTILQSSDSPIMRIERRLVFHREPHGPHRTQSRTGEERGVR